MKDFVCCHTDLLWLAGFVLSQINQVAVPLAPGGVVNLCQHVERLCGCGRLLIAEEKIHRAEIEAKMPYLPDKQYFCAGLTAAKSVNLI